MTSEQPTANGNRSHESGSVAIKIEALKVYEKRPLKAFVDFTLTDIGLRINGAMIHEKEGKRWVGMPARGYQTGEGRAWSPIVDLSSKEVRAAIDDAVHSAYDSYVEQQLTENGGRSW